MEQVEHRITPKLWQIFMFVSLSQQAEGWAYMLKDLVPYEQALALKELGFDEKCFGYYNIDPSLDKPYLNDKCKPFEHEWCLPAPTFSQAFRWFREKYGLYSWITMELGNKSTFCWVLSGEHTSTQYAAYFHTYEEAELACLNKLIEIKNNV